MAKMGRTQGAVGFAVYMDQLERFFAQHEDYDVDAAIYHRGGDPAVLIKTVQALTAQGRTVLVLPEGSAGVRARSSYLVEGTEVRELG